MKKPSICGVVTEHDEDSIRNANPRVDLFELRLDMLGATWPKTARLLMKPWIATNRLASEGGGWHGTEVKRIEVISSAVEAGASIVDIELASPGLNRIVDRLRNKAECLISYHNVRATPSLEELKGIVRCELNAGADICKVATTALTFDDNVTVLSLLSAFPGVRLVSLAMGDSGQASRIFGPMFCGEFTYASLQSGAESAPGQLSIGQLLRLYEALGL